MARDWTELRPVGYGVASDSKIDKISVFFAKEPCKRDNILQKRPIILSSLLAVATAYSLPEAARVTTKCITLQHIATHRNTPHHTATYTTARVRRVGVDRFFFAKCFESRIHPSRAFCEEI